MREIVFLGRSIIFSVKNASVLFYVGLRRCSAPRTPSTKGRILLTRGLSFYYVHILAYHIPAYSIMEPPPR